MFDVDRAVEAYTNRMLRLHYGDGEEEPCCKTCYYHEGTECALCEYKDGVPEYPTVDDDDYCDNYQRIEEPEW